MHEAAITEALVDQVREFLPAGAALCEVLVEVGALEHLDADVMETIWQATTSGSDLAGAVLRITPIALEIRCRACGKEHSPTDPAILLCPGCGAAAPEVLRGSGVVLRSIEVEEP